MILPVTSMFELPPNSVVVRARVWCIHISQKQNCVKNFLLNRFRPIKLVCWKSVDLLFNENIIYYSIISERVLGAEFIWPAVLLGNFWCKLIGKILNIVDYSASAVTVIAFEALFSTFIVLLKIIINIMKRICKTQIPANFKGLLKLI